MLLAILALGSSLAFGADTPGTAPAMRAAVVVPPSACEVAKRKLVVYAMGLRAYCSKNEDCSAFSLGEGHCMKPHVYRKDAHVADDKNLQALQAKVREACASAWALEGACAPYEPSVACRDGKCVDAKSE